ncbi:MAG: hypothetical protein AAF570_14135, partial [Bacteroidota bacterium]
DTSDIEVFVRAIDNDDAVDPSPAYLLVPIKNTAPVAIFDTIQPIPDTTFVVTTFFLDVTDLDGNDNLDSIFFKVNNSPWYALPPNTNTLTLAPQDPTVSGSAMADVFTGPEASLQPDPISDLLLDGDNQVFLKAKDIAGSESEVDTSEFFFVKRKTSDLLLVSANASTNPAPSTVIDPALQNINVDFDRIDLRVNGGLNVPTLWTPTFSFFINYYDQIFWYGDASNEALSLLENAAGAVQAYLSQGGKMLINMSFPNSFENESVVLEFTPVDSLSTSTGSVRLPTDSLVYPVGNSALNYDTLKASVFVGAATPFYVKSTAETMFDAQLFISGWVGPSSVIAKTTNGSGQTNLVFCSVELQQLNGNPAGLETFLNQVLLNEFNW